MSEKEANTIVALGETIPIQTANGEVELIEKVEKYIRDLKISVWAHLLPNTVAVLSLGLLVDDLFFSYHWTPKQKPYLKRGKVKVTCHLDFLPTNHLLKRLRRATERDGRKLGKRKMMARVIGK